MEYNYTNLGSVFDIYKESILALDPVTYCERYLTLDGEPFRLNGNGYKPFADIYRYIGIMALSSNSKPVILVKGRQVGATTMASALELFFMTCDMFGRAGRPPMRIMHAFPFNESALAFSKTKLNPMITTAVVDKQEALLAKQGKKVKSMVEKKIDKSSSVNSSLNFKQFINGNYIEIQSTGLDGKRLRGRSVDAIFFDEVQDIPGDALGNVGKSLQQAKYGNKGIKVYFGTPRQKGSEYWRIWQKSSQQYYYLGCESCKEYFPLYTPGSDDWEEIWIEDELDKDHPSHGYIVKCTHCGHEQDKRPAAERGKWFSSVEDPDECSYIGYHINMLYMPKFTRQDIINEKPENHPLNTERIYRNEVLGEFFAGDASPITVEEMRSTCTDYERGMRGYIALEEDKKVYLGCDWGKKVDADQLSSISKARQQRGQSYSSVVVLSVDKDNPMILNIEYAKLLKNNEMEYKKSIVDEMFRKFNIYLGVGDIGYAHELTYALHTTYGDSFLASEAGGRMKNSVKFVKDEYPKVIRFTKDYFIGELYDMLKKGRIRFPMYKCYEQMAWLMHHIASMEIKPTLDRSGEPIIRYVKGSTPNDGFMALLNAYLAYKFDITNGFTEIDPERMKKNPTEKNKPLVSLGYVPGMNPMKRNSQIS